jgi:hypothetical protein
MRGSLFQIITFIDPTVTRAVKAKLLLQLERHSLIHVDLPPLVSVKTTGVCIPVGISEVLLAALYKSPGKTWSDADITELLSFRRKSIFAGDLNAKHPFWNSTVSNPSGEKPVDLLHFNEFEVSAAQCPTHFSPAGIGDVLDIVVNRNIRVSDVIVSDILDSDYLPIVFHILDPIIIGIFQNLLKNLQIGTGFKALPLN